MKKVILSLAVICSAALVSCGGNKAAEADSAAEDTAVVVEEVAEVAVDTAADSAAVDTAVAVEAAVAE